MRDQTTGPLFLIPLDDNQHQASELLLSDVGPL